MNFGLGGFGIGGYAPPDALTISRDRRRTRMMLRFDPLVGWTCTDGMRFGMDKIAATDHQSRIRDIFEGELEGGWIGIGWLDMNPLWASSMSWMTEEVDFRIFKMWQEHLSITGQSAQESRVWLMETINEVKFGGHGIHGAGCTNPRITELADRMISMSFQLGGNVQGRVDIGNQSSNQQRQITDTSTTTTTTTTTTATTEERFTAANNWLKMWEEGGRKNYTPDQAREFTDLIRKGHKDKWVQNNLAKTRAGHHQQPAPQPAPPQPVFTPAPPAYTPVQLPALPPPTPLPVMPYQAPPQPAQQSQAGQQSYQKITVETSQVVSSSNQGNQGYAQTPGFPPPRAFPAQLTGPPAQQYLTGPITPARQYLTEPSTSAQITQGPDQSQYMQYSQQSQQMSWNGAPPGHAQPSFPPPGSPPPQGFVIDEEQYEPSSPSYSYAAPKEEKKKKSKKHRSKDT